MNYAAHQFTQMADTVTVAATDASGSTANDLSHPWAGKGLAATVLVTNLGTDKAFVKFGNSSVSVTTTTGIPVLAGESRVFALNKASHAAAVCASTETATVYFTPGAGR